jgi:hypothetical protein
MQTEDSFHGGAIFLPDMAGTKNGTGFPATFQRPGSLRETLRDFRSILTVALIWLSNESLFILYL